MRFIIWDMFMNFVRNRSLMGLGFFEPEDKMRKREIMHALAGGIVSPLPTELVQIILDYVFDIQVGTSSVRFWVWLHPKKTRRPRQRHEDGRGPP